MSDKNRQCHAFDTMMTIKKIDVARSRQPVEDECAKRSSPPFRHRIEGKIVINIVYER